MTMNQKYRWLTLGHKYVYQPKIGKGDDARRLSICTVRILPRAGSKPANALVEFSDGYQAVVPTGVLRKQK